MWQPQSQGLEQIVMVLRNSNSPDNLTQLQVQKQLKEFMNIPDYNNYLMYILTQMPNEPESVRAAAGLLLKNNIKNSVNFHQSVLPFIQECCLKSLGDPHNLVRSTIAIIITTIVSRMKLEGWPQLLPFLMESLNSSNQQLVEGVFTSLCNICEDSGVQLIHHPQKPLNFLIPKFIELSDSPQLKIRTGSLFCLNQFITHGAEPLFQHLQAFIGALSKRATDSAGEVRKLVCQSFVWLLEAKPEILVPQLNSIFQFMLYALQDKDEAVALEACEFWLSFAEHEEFGDHLQMALPNLIPVLLKNSVYSDYDIIALGGDDEDDEQVPDRQEDIKPRHYKAKTHSLEHQEQENKQPKEKKADAEEDDDDEEEDEDDDEIYAEWNLRKCSAATLDLISNIFPVEILPILLPLLNQFLFHQEWKYKEAGILILGAVAEGCMSGIEQHLPQLIPFMLQSLKDPKPLVRSIACWTLGRYCRWCIYPTDGTQDKSKYLEPMLKGLLDTILDRNKRVQEAGCSAFASMEEEAGEELVPYLPHILQVLVTAFQKYQKKNLLILYDAIGTLAEAVGSQMNQPALIQLLMPSLIQKWNQLGDDDIGLFPLLECLCSVAISIGPGFKPFAQPVYERCLRLIQNTLQQQHLYQQQQQQQEEPDKDFMIVALDLISGLIQGIGADSQSLLQSTQPSLFDLLLLCLKDPSAEVRQSGFALVGDLAINCFPVLKPYLVQMMPILIENVDPKLSTNFQSVCNNACWAAGEISLHYGMEMSPFFPALIERLLPILKNQEFSRTLHENAAIAIGRLGILVPEMICPYLEQFAEEWLRALQYTRDNGEKHSAFIGFCQMIEKNPQAVVNSLSTFGLVLSQWNTTGDLEARFARIWKGYKDMFGAQWQAWYESHFSQQTREKLSQRFQI